MSSRLVALVVCGGAILLSQAHADNPLLRQLAPQPKVDAAAEADYTLRDTHGPWLVMAATFNGEGAAQQAQELVLELRQQYNLPAYVHQMTFQHEDQNLGRGIDQYGDRIRRRYQTDATQEIAVLVGDFATIDDQSAQQRLDQIKYLQPKALVNKDFSETTQSLAREREFLRRMKGEKELGPMKKAFLTRNPLLPEEYFKPKGVDNFVANMNKGVDNSLLDCPGKYTVRIATFKGHAILEGAFQSGKKNSTKAKTELDPLEEAALKAHHLTVFLRAKGWEAYEFHDRTESCVCVGGFNDISEQNIEVIIRTFGAAYDTPGDLTPKMSQGRPTVDPNAVKQQFASAFSQHGKVAAGLQPKFVQPLPKVVIPLDIHPRVIEAPKRSVSSAYVWNR